MQIAKPQVHLREGNCTGTYHIHVVTWFDQTRFKSNGVESISTTATNGVFTIVLKVAEDTSVPDLELLTPVVHTFTVEELELGTEDPLLEIILINSSDNDAELGKRKTHHADAEASAMPSPIGKLTAK